MRILFTAPRYHTNQAPIVKGLISKGHEVRYFVAYKGAVEDYSFCKPIVLKLSKHIQKKITRTKNKEKQNKIQTYSMEHFIPDFQFLRKRFEEYSPELVICREKTPLTLCVNALCDEFKVPCILYDQEPYLKIAEKKDNSVTVSENSSKKISLAARIQIKLYRKIDPDQRMLASFRKTTGFPCIRITPVMVSVAGKNMDESAPAANSYFLPFVYEAPAQVKSRTYCDNNKLRILCVGKYREYKNLPLFIKAISLIKNKAAIQVTIVGQAVSEDECRYYKKIESLVKEYNIDSVVKLIKNIKHTEMKNIYLSHDLLVLPTKNECASISVLEAMGHGLAVISTDHNGTASYIEDDVCGYTFKTCDAEDLAGKITRYIEKENVEVHGRNSCKIIKDKYSFEVYYKVLSEMLKKEYGMLQ